MFYKNSFLVKISKHNWLTVFKSRNLSLLSKTSSLDYCVNLVKSHDYENFLCTLLLSNLARNTAFAVRAFNIEVSRVADHTSEKNIAALRMKFWEKTLDDVYQDKVPEHPVAQELARAIKKHQLFKRNLLRLIKARSNIIDTFCFESMEAMETYVEETVSPIYYLILQASGIQNLQADHAASHLGKAQGLTNLLRALPHNVSRRQLLLPQDILLKHSVAQEDILRRLNQQAVKQVIFDVASSANLHLQKARSLRDSFPKEASRIFLPAVAVASFLENLKNLDFDIFNPFIHQRNTRLGGKLFWRKLFSRY